MVLIVVVMKNSDNNELIFRQSSVIPFQVKNEQIEILLITSLKNRKWIFPKGLVENSLSPQQSALKEAFEEAGIEGSVLDMLLGEYDYYKWDGICHVEVFPLLVTRIYDTWPESEQRDRQWFSLQNAITLVEKEELRIMLRRFDQNTSKILSLVKEQD
jgi:8-oxo-dGTP pyrophosphatase MutT (NUDIX family)